MSAPKYPVGGMWRRADRNGKEYFFFQVEIGDTQYSFHAFSNKYKEKPTHPEFRIYPLEEGGERPAYRADRKPRVTEEDRRGVKPPPPDDDPEAKGEGVEADDAVAEDDDLPF